MSTSTLNHPLSAGGNLRSGGVSRQILLSVQWSCFYVPLGAPCTRSRLVFARARAKAGGEDDQPKNPKNLTQTATEEAEEVEEELPWIQEKALDLVEFTGTVTQAIPGPRVGHSSLPWILAVPLAYVGLSFVVSVFKAVKKFTSPRAKRKRLVNKNALLLKSIDDLYEKSRDEVNYSALKGLMQKTGFSMDDILRKYIRYTLNEKPFSTDTVADLIHLRKASMLDDSQVAAVLNDTSMRIVKEKGPVVMDISGFTEKGFKRKLAVQALFGKVFFLSEIPDFCSRDSLLMIKEIFGVTDEDADSLRMHTLSRSGDVDALEKLVDDDADSEEHEDESQKEG
ncbi:hypothetical protein AXF42_Ash014699 [Apostasia shenzhenica]|uniref:Armadillo-like repeats domain-containing protein n=1 Tax=Apostasia shenzhenica TaxID=1088818 RepID=A0A2I0AKP7_9ASPA|nr:hypothetical protein AXF42_Ash014699 [Apostasia shenzhenica]